MAALTYKLEFNYDESTRSDSSVFIQLRANPPIYQARIDKEDYDVLPAELKNEFLTNIFNVSGVTELSVKCYRIWLMKSPVYSWEEVLLPVLYYIASYYGLTQIEQMFGSGNTDGSGCTLNTPIERRKI
jgi:hypothetical protein